MKGNPALLEESKVSMKKCKSLLQEISTTCCMPERSPSMDKAFVQLTQIDEELNLAHSNVRHVETSISQVGALGGMIGHLYATCCTAVREPLYQKMFKEMNFTHGKLWVYLGHSH